MRAKAARACTVAALLLRADGFFSSGHTATRLDRQRNVALPHQPCGCGSWRQAVAATLEGRAIAPKVLGATNADVDTEVDALEDISDGAGTCFKRILQRGDGSQKHPRAGNKVVLHYTIHVAGSNELVHSTRKAHADGDEAAAAAEEDTPFDFYLGRTPSEAMLGWEMALPTMEKGERALIVCTPECAYGAAGAPPKIPPSATLECELELLSWTDLLEKYRPYTRRNNESRDERMSRWEAELQEGTSPMQGDLNVGTSPHQEEQQQQQQQQQPYGDMVTGITEVTDQQPEFQKKDRIVDLNDPKVKQAAAKQVLCGQGEGYTYMERTTYMDVFVPAPEGTIAADVDCKITPKEISLKLKGAGLYLLQGPLWGRIHVDGSYWCITDRSVEQFDGAAPDVSFGLKQGGLFVEVYLDKKKPSDIFWPDLFADETDDSA